MQKIKEKIHSRIKHHLKSIEKDLYGTYISFSVDYKKIKPPHLNEYFIKNLFEDGSCLTKLLDLNKNAKQDSEKILDNKFRVFNSILSYNSEPDFWYKDFFSAGTYPCIPYTKLKVKLNKGMDYIVPLELSRLQFIPTLIQAHRISKDKKIFDFFISIIDDWIYKNPCLIGINWNCSMDIGIRGINLGLGLIYFWMLIPEDKREYYLKVLWAHAVYILNNESFKQKDRKQKHNHYLVSSISLLFFSLCFNGKLPYSYLNETFKELKREIINQFKEDGVNFEAANHYHQFALEAILLAEVFLSSHNSEKNNLSLLDEHQVKERIEKALMFVSDYMQTNTLSPQFGDSSDGRVLFFKDYFDWNPLDHIYLFDLSSQLFPSNKNNNQIIDSFYPESGYAFYKNEKFGISLSCSKISENESGHNHLDKASFVLQVKENPLFIDSGTYCYTSDFKKRNEFRSTRSHNTIIIDSKEQINYRKTGAFTPLNNINTEIQRIQENNISFRLTHDGYKREDNLGLIKRLIKCYNDKIEMEELIEGTGNHLVEIIFNLHPEIKFNTEDRLIKFYRNGKELCNFEFDNALSFSVEDSFYSPAYKKEVTNKRIVLSNKVLLPAKFINTLNIS